MSIGTIEKDFIILFIFKTPCFSLEIQKMLIVLAFSNNFDIISVSHWQAC